MFLTEGRWKVSLEWTSIDLFSKLSLTCEDNVKYYKIVYHPILTLSVRKGNTLEIFKINQEALPSITSNYLESPKENVLREYDAATFTMLYSEVIHNMVSQNS